jgi:uncharacterized protein (TIRG00374 family)
MRKFWLFLFSLLIGVFLFSWVLKSVGWSEIKRAFLIFTLWQGIVILFLTFLIALVGTWEWKVILKSEGINVSSVDLFKSYLAGFSIMYLFPMAIFGKEIFRSYVLKRKNSVSWTKGMASVIIDRILDFTAELAFIFFGIFFLLLVIGVELKKLGIILGVFLVLMTGLSFFYFKIFKRESIVKFFIKFFIPKYQNDHASLHIEEEIFNFFKIKDVYMWQGFGLTFFEKIIKLLKTWFLIIFLGKTIGFLPVLSVLGFSYLSALIPIPASLGNDEAIQTFVFGSLGLGANTGTAFTLIDRGAELIIALIGLLILFGFGLKSLEMSLSEKR